MPELSLVRFQFPPVRERPGFCRHAASDRASGLRSRVPAWTSKF